MSGMAGEQAAVLEGVPEESRRRAEGLLRELGRRQEVLALASRSVAVASGKGGVGKTVTAVNLALHFAREGRRVALVDLDPLSDAASLLDLTESESALSAGPLAGAERQLADFTLPAFKNLDLLFPSPKLRKGESLTLLELIYGRFAAELVQGYDLAIFDLPAGAGYEENLAFLPFMKSIVLVTNPEPTAHAAAGTYLHRLFSLYPQRDIQLWHNRFVPEALPGFNPVDVAGNYNRNVPSELRLVPEQTSRLSDLAFIPEDPALNLLRGEATARRNAQRLLLDTLQFLQEQHLRRLAAEAGVARSLQPLLAGYLGRHRRLEEPEAYLEQLGGYLATLAGRGAETRAFTPQERQLLLDLVHRLRRDALYRALARAIRLLEDSLQRRGQPKGLVGDPAERPLDQELGRLLVALNRLASRQRALVNPAGVLLFYFALYKLLRSETVARLIGSLVPRRRTARGQTVRDRRRQIRSLVEQDPAHRARYLKLVRLLAPVVFRQVATVVKTMGLERLEFRDARGNPLHAAYLKLLTNFLHDTAYSGLSVVVGFPNRSTALAFREGAERLRTHLAAG